MWCRPSQAARALICPAEQPGWRGLSSPLPPLLPMMPLVRVVGRVPGAAVAPGVQPGPAPPGPSALQPRALGSCASAVPGYPSRGPLQARPWAGLSLQGMLAGGCRVGTARVLGRGGLPRCRHGLGADGGPVCSQGCRPASWRSAAGPCGPAAPTATSPDATESPTKTLLETTGRRSLGA